MPLTESFPGSGIMLFVCEEKGCREQAVYGYDVNLRKAMETRNAKYGGRWFCKNHVPADGLLTHVPHHGPATTQETKDVRGNEGDAGPDLFG